MKNIVLIAGSRNLQSKTKIAVHDMASVLQEHGMETLIIDLAQVDMDHCDGRELKDYGKSIVQCYKALESADAIIIGMPVYCYSIAGPLKNFIDITSEAFTGKKFGVICNAGSKVSYLAAQDLQKVLGYECESIPLFPIVMTDGSSYQDGQLTDKRAQAKMENLANIIKQAI